jgi:hypothetical protein
MNTRTCRNGDVGGDGGFVGRPDGAAEFAKLGEVDGFGDGAPDGLSDDLIDSISEGEPDGFPNGELDGLRDGISEGEPDGFHAGDLDGSLDGVSESELDGVTDGEMGRSLDASSDGEPDVLFVGGRRPTGRCESSKGVQRGPHVKPSSPLGLVQCALSNICSKSRAMAAVQVGATALVPKIETVGISKIKSCRRAIYGGENEVAVPID